MAEAVVSLGEHLFNNLSLLLLSIFFLPLDFAVLSLYHFWGKLFHREVISQNTSSRKTVLVTGTRMTKCLTLCRTFHLAGHRVIAAETRPWGKGSANKYSRSIAAYYDLPNQATPEGLREYVAELKRIIQLEKIDLWIPVSGVQTTVEDCEAAVEVEKSTPCRVFQYKPDICKTLHEKDLFIEKTTELGLTVPETHRFTDKQTLVDFLDHESKQRHEKGPTKKLYILKCVGVDDISRSGVPLLPCINPFDNRQAVQHMNISPQNPFILQQFVKGQEFCTHAVVTHGEVRAFGACKSSELLMYYDPLPSKCGLTEAMLDFTKHYAKNLDDGELVGQLSFDFMVSDPEDGRDLLDLRKDEITLYPIECNPRTHTAVVMFQSQPKELAAAHLSIFQDRYAVQNPKIVEPASSTRGKYWIGHDVVTLLVIPLLDLVMMKTTVASAWDRVSSFLLHLTFWQDAVLESWDPLPWFALYHVHWPIIFIRSLWTGRRWSRVNISTTKVFDAHYH